MGQPAKAPRENRTMPVDFHEESTSFQLLSDGNACVEFVLAFMRSIGCQLKHKSTGIRGGCITRHAHDARLRLGGLTIWRMQCTSCDAVCTVLPHCGLRDRQMSPEGARDALLATHGGLRLEWCAAVCPISPMALYRLVCALGQHSLVTGLVKCHLRLPA